jgi:hypothetical protein
VKELSNELKNQIEAFEDAPEKNKFLNSLPFEPYQILEFAARELSETDRLFPNDELSKLYEILSKILNVMHGGSEETLDKDFLDQLYRIVWRK